MASAKESEPCGFQLLFMTPIEAWKNAYSISQKRECEADDPFTRF